MRSQSTADHLNITTDFIINPTNETATTDTPPAKQSIKVIDFGFNDKITLNYRGAIRYTYQSAKKDENNLIKSAKLETDEYKVNVLFNEPIDANNINTMLFGGLGRPGVGVLDALELTLS